MSNFCNIFFQPPLCFDHLLLNLKIFFKKYSPHIDVVVVQMLLAVNSYETIQNVLGETILPQLFIQWFDLYKETKCVIQNPDEYSAWEPPTIFNVEDKQFLHTLIFEQPGLFLEKNWEKLYDYQQPMESTEAVHIELTQRLNLALKRAFTSNVCKSLYQLDLYRNWTENIPAEMMVFTDDQFLFPLLE